MELAADGFSPFEKCVIGLVALVCWFLLVELVKALQSKKILGTGRGAKEE
jgi:hypothetical protein